jgi:CRP-like cAMP-binding protein
MPMKYSSAPWPARVAASPLAARRYASGERIHEALASGTAWRVSSGAVRLDALGEDGPVFAGLAVPGDIVGAETLLLGICHFRATALTPSVLTPWPGSVSSPGASLLGALAQAQQRGASLVALRAGQAIDRVARLIRLLVPEGNGQLLVQIVLPPLRDMADITALTMETVSRSLSSLRRLGMLEPDGQRRGRGDKTCLCLVPEMTVSA